MKAVLLLVLMFSCAACVQAQESGGVMVNELNRIQLSLINNFLFLLPPLLWNLIFTSKLSRDSFSRKAPDWLKITEHVFRGAAMFYPLLLPVNTNHELFVPGLAVYLTGLALYFGSWTVQLIDPESRLSKSAVIQFAPAFTPLIWFAGIAMMSESVIMAAASTLFVGIHIALNIVEYRKN